MRDDAGFTLIEVMVVLALSAMVTLGIVAFYLSAQATWTDSSSQVMAQRDASSVLEAIAVRARDASSATIINDAGTQNSTLVLYRKDLTERARIFWSDKDSLIHFSDSADSIDQGPLVGTRALRFSCSTVDSLGLVSVDSLRMISASGQVVSVSSAFGMTNRVLP
jgi:prepilin-type N-terminal cleavage/methylation domain-containing protein